MTKEVPLRENDKWDLHLGELRKISKGEWYAIAVMGTHTANSTVWKFKKQYPDFEFATTKVDANTRKLYGRTKPIEPVIIDEETVEPDLSTVQLEALVKTIQNKLGAK